MGLMYADAESLSRIALNIVQKPLERCIRAESGLDGWELFATIVYLAHVVPSIKGTRMQTNELARYLVNGQPWKDHQVLIGRPEDVKEGVNIDKGVLFFRQDIEESLMTAEGALPVMVRNLQSFSAKDGGWEPTFRGAEICVGHRENTVGRFIYEIPTEDADFIINSKPLVIEKTQYLFWFENGVIWGVDVYHGSLEGLVIANFQNDQRKPPDDVFMPEWLGEDISEKMEYSDYFIALKGAVIAQPECCAEHCATM